MIDQRLLIPEPYQRLVWFLFPSEVLGELLRLKYQAPLEFEAIEEFNRECWREPIEATLPFQPRDYNKGKYEFKFSEEYMEVVHAHNQDSNSSSEETKENSVDSNNMNEKKIQEVKV